MIKETKILLEYAGKIKADCIHDYVKNKGYKALQKSLFMNQKDIIAEIESSKLRGRGGSGHYTGEKMKTANKSQKKKQDNVFLVATTDETEPQSFKDQVIMENITHALIEGMIITAFAINATKGVIYILEKYEKSIDRVKKAIEQAYDHGFLGENIMHSNFDFDIEVKSGKGSFFNMSDFSIVETEETQGLSFYEKLQFRESPTLINNIETLTNIPHIISKGAEWFKSIGEENTPGTRLINVSGDVNNSNCFEVTTDTSLKDIIYNLAGGIKEEKTFKGALLGGVTGSFINERFLNSCISYDCLQSINAHIGSGDIIVISEGSSIKPSLRDILEFYHQTSCEKCKPESKQLLDFMDKIESEKGNEKENLKKMLKKAREMKSENLCHSSPPPLKAIETAIRYFKDDFLV